MAKLSDGSVTLSMMSDPLNLQKLVLDDIQDRFTGGQVLVDPNQTSMFLLEQFCTSTANLAKATENTLSSWLPKRALTNEDLYKHMSDYDYVNLFSGPSTAKIDLYLDKTYLYKYAEIYNNNYKLAVIPEKTIFKLGSLDFGIYYPINIRINRHTGYITVVWDTNVENSIHTLNSNLLASSTFSYMGMELLKVSIPIYQFTRTYLEDTVIPGTGFAKKISFNDKFYAAKFYTNNLDNNKIELHQELGKNTYNPDIPTVRMQVLLDENALSINIPQIYITNEQIGSKIFSEIYTTKGDITPSIVSLEAEQLKINFGIDNTSSKYSKVLEGLPTLFFTVQSEQTSGGNDGLDFEGLRNRVVHNSFHTSALITPIDLQNYFYDKGFTVVKYKDNLTNLTYYAYKQLRDSNNSIIPSANMDIALTEDVYKNYIYSTEKDENGNTLELDPSSRDIVQNPDGTITIKPSTLYKYDNNTLSCKPLSYIEKLNLSKLSKEEQIIEYNNNTYTYSPFHMRLITDPRYPYVSSYNLMNPFIKNVKFNFENDSITAVMNISGIAIVPTNNNGTDGYTITLMCQQSQDLYTVREEDIAVYLYTTDTSGTYIGKEATFIKYENGISYYEIYIDTNYHINKNHEIDIDLVSDRSNNHHYVNLEQQYYIAFMVDSEYFPDAITEESTFEGISNKYKQTHTVMIKQEFTMSLGYALDDVIFNSINMLWSGTEYQRYNCNVIDTYKEDVYLVEDGVPVYTINETTGNIEFTIIHHAGDIVEDSNGNPIYKHVIGDKVLDSSGNEIKISSRVLQYYIQAIMIDAKLQLSSHPDSIAYVNRIPNLLETYFSVIRTATDNLLERDKVFFKPMQTLGYGQFYIGNNATITLPLELSLRFKIYVDNEAYSSSELREAITNTCISIAESHLSKDRISLVEMANEFVNQIVHVEYVDVLGINGDVDLQTLIVSDDSLQPSIKQEVYVTKNGQINIRKAIDIEFSQSVEI